MLVVLGGHFYLNVCCLLPSAVMSTLWITGTLHPFTQLPQLRQILEREKQLSADAPLKESG